MVGESDRSVSGRGLAPGPFNFKETMMRRSAVLTVVSLIAMGLAGNAFADGFEGVVHFQSTRDGKVREYDYLIKGDKVRIEVEGEENRQVNVILDWEHKKTILLMPERKMVMEMPMKEEGETDRSASGEKSLSFTRTGKTETILGHTCEHLLVKAEDSETEICGVKGMGHYAGMHRPRMGGSSEGAPAWAKELKEQGFFPLRVVTKGSDGRETSRLEATKVEKKTLDPGLFAAPADYQKFDRGSMPGMGGPGGMRGGPPGGPGAMPPAGGQ
jgi:Domain of unknown function (DUF4412)